MRERGRLLQTSSERCYFDAYNGPEKRLFRSYFTYFGIAADRLERVMGLFDEPENETPAADDSVFDDDSKIRLFETQRRESESSTGYLKKFMPVAIVAVLIVASLIYFMQPGIGSAVKPPKEVEDSVYEYMRSKEHRSVREITFYNCDGWYWVKILAEPRGSESVDDPANEYRLRVERSGDNASNIQTLPVPNKDTDVPCR